MDDNMMMRMVLLFVVIALTGCSSVGRVFPDNSNEYQQARSIPNLELPPDLTSNASNNFMDIPGGRSQVSLSAQTARDAIRMAEIRTIDNDRSLLVLPEGLDAAWNAVDKALQAGSIEINSKDQSNRTFNVTYKTGEDEGWFSRLAFWRSNSYPFTIRLSDVDETTELTVLEKNGEWATSLESELLLSSIRTQYNASRAQ
jgi:outer membrane protein assembly factor BamC